MQGVEKDDLKNLQQFADIIPAAFYWLDMQQYYVLVNSLVLEVTGTDSFEKNFAGKTPMDLYPKEMAQEIIDHHKAVIKTGQPLCAIESIQDVTTKVHKVFSATIAPFCDDQGRVIGTCGVSIDITKEVKLTERLKIANTAKSEFIANMSHDLNTPMAGVSGMLDALLLSVQKAQSALSSGNLDSLPKMEQMFKELINRSLEYVTIAKNSTTELMNLFSEILEVTRLESGKVDVQAGVFDVRVLIQRNIDILRSVAMHKNLDLSLTIKDTVPQYLKGYNTYLDRILTNLISNALKFTNNGQVEIRVDVSDEPLAGYSDSNGSILLCIEVEDTGVGIPKDQLQKIFDRFSRLTSSYAGVYKGAGLGLYAIKHYVKVMQGAVDVKSTVDEGSCFTVVLPFAKVEDIDNVDDVLVDVDTPKLSVGELIPDLASQATQSVMQATVDSAEISILLVEDNDVVAMAEKLLLEHLHCSVVLARTGKDALEKTKAGKYDLILMDVGLSDFSGIEVTRRILSLPNKKCSQIPIVGVTGHAANAAKRKECLEAGMQEVLSKPVQLPALEAVIKQFVIKRRKIKASD